MPSARDKTREQFLAQAQRQGTLPVTMFASTEQPRGSAALQTAQRLLGGLPHVDNSDRPSVRIQRLAGMLTQLQEADREECAVVRTPRRRHG